ncbi:hypothetical protein EK21DRAFT_101794 [Setomelanomma holmii]|uniref:Cation/H+ exchanger transmembrane domain-containing protein n=1 Tax=Setomelanomma holmii TaxID=210430 RepID=A0A9P4H5B3_9PLEO|nr:hypothetical protein EK21DRAFT_101794 [Setomelanomma holmii]
MSGSASSLPYHEPGIVTILILASFLLLLNVVNTRLDKVLYCGLLGQVFLGIAYGGLHTSFQSLKANFLPSAGVAITGIAVPVGLSYTLQGLLDTTPVQAFAAGAALCSTSLGTTFTVLASSGLSTSRFGVVMTSAAMMDDVLGLVMVQVISDLGGDDFSWVTVFRPVLVSVAFAVLAPIVCLIVVKPVTIWLNLYRQAHPAAALVKVLQKPEASLAVHTLLLIGLITGATYAGTSNLFAAYIAGASLSWWDTELPHPAIKDASSSSIQAQEIKAGRAPRASSTGRAPSGARDDNGQVARDVHEQSPSVATSDRIDEQDHRADTCGSAIYTRYYHPAVSVILQPLFFASIGFSIPITRMFTGSIVWRGIVYATLMAFAKLVCGLWLVGFPARSQSRKGTVSQLLGKMRLDLIPHLWGKSERAKTSPRAGATSSANPAKSVSLHPPLILALAMCARGEIGFLISGVAESTGAFSATGQATEEPSNIFLVVTLAIVLCTIIGHLGVGLSVRRVKKLQSRKNKQQDGAGRDVLGVWGVD